MKKMIIFDQVGKVYVNGEKEIHANRDVNFEINEGEFCVIVGASGAGKTTILNTLGGIDTITNGDVSVDGILINKLSQKELTKYRRHDIGFVFQFYNLMPQLTALENVELASEICLNPLDTKEVLEMVELGERLNNFPSQLSGGEQQRVAIARAVAKNPKIILCDEPTGALDHETGVSILKLLQQMCHESKKTVVLVTHNSAITQMADRVIQVRNGTVSKVILNSSPLPVEKIVW